MQPFLKKLIPGVLLSSALLLTAAEERSNMIDFSNLAQNGKYTVNTGVTYKIVPDEKSGKSMVEVTVTPFSEHKNRWPIIWITAKAFGTPLDLSGASKIDFTTRKVTEGLGQLTYMLVSPFNPDSGRNIEYIPGTVPGGNETTTTFSLADFKKPCSDPSVINMIGITFPESDKTEVYQILSFEAVKDDANGTMTDRLVREAELVKIELKTLSEALDKAGDAESEQFRKELKQLDSEFKKIENQLKTAQITGFAGQYNPIREKLRDIVNRSGKIFLSLQKKELLVWSYPDALPFPADLMPRPSSQLLDNLELKMAGGEYRDLTFVVTAAEKPLHLEIDIQGPSALTNSTDIFFVDFFKYDREKIALGELMRPVTDPLEIPAGQSREIRLRVNGDSAELTPGKYDFTVHLRDQSLKLNQSIPAQLTVWDFDLYPLAKLDNNGYARFNTRSKAELAGQLDSLTEMKRYGMNMVLVESWALTDAKFDDKGNLTHFNSTPYMDLNIRDLKKLWDLAPGKQPLKFILMCHTDAHLPPANSPEYANALGQWTKKLADVMQSYTISPENYFLFLGDEASPVKLLNKQIPNAEIIKKVNPQIRIFQNSSQIFADKATNQRYLALFDHFEPNFVSLEKNKRLLPELKKSEKLLSSYKCDQFATLHADIYAYYRLYAWQSFQTGIYSIGLWTFNSWNELAKPANNYGIGYQMIVRNPDGSISPTRRYHLYRDGLNDLRYLLTLRESAKPEQKAIVEDFISETIQSVLSQPQDKAGAEKARIKLAEKIIELQGKAK